MKFLSFFPLFVCMLLIACGGAKSSSEESAPQQAPTSQQEALVKSEEAESDSYHAKDMLYPWVDKLNVRATPDPSGKVVASVGSTEALEALGETSPETFTYVLRGGTYMDHWYKVKTPDGQEGWVFGGAVKRKGEEKGNAPITPTKFNFPHFGEFDLSSWDIFNRDKDAGDISCLTKYCEAGDVALIIDSCNSEYGYRMRYTYVVYHGKSDTLHTRDFYFDGYDLSQDDGGPTRYELRETVEDFEANPPKRYTRTQTVDKHYNQLNARPVIAIGPWKESVMEE